MFIETITGRLQNVMFLQEVIIVNNDGIYSIGYVQSNGEIIEEGSYSTLEEAQSIKSDIEDELLSLS